MHFARAGDSKKNTTQSKSTKAQNNNKSTNKQPLIPGFGKAPSNERYMWRQQQQECTPPTRSLTAPVSF